MLNAAAQLPGCSAGPKEAHALFLTLDKDGGGYICKEEFKNPPTVHTDADMVATLDERRRALDYIMHCEKGYSIMELLGHESNLAIRKKTMYLIYGSAWYNLLVGIVLFAHLGMCFMEAPAGRLALRPAAFYSDKWERPNATAVQGANTGILNVEDQFDTVLFVSLALILLQFVDMALQIAVNGIHVRRRIGC